MEKKEFITIGIIAAMFVASWLLLPSLPQRIPTHWNENGVVDGYGPSWMAFLLPAMSLFIYAMFWAIPHLDPHKKNVLEFYKRHGFGLKLSIVLFMAAIQLAMLAAAMGQRMGIVPVISICMGALFAYLGWIMRGVKRNYFIGFRTPWALADERNWDKTHEFGGKVFVAVGLLTILLTLLGISMLWRLLVMGAGIVAISAYSYLQFRGK